MTRYMMLSLLVLSACGKDLCQKMADDAEACGTATTDASLDACRDSLSACSKKDERKIEDMYDCMVDAGLMECEPDSEMDTTDGMDALADMMACGSMVIGVSPECVSAVSMDTTTTTTTFSTL